MSHRAKSAAPVAPHQCPYQTRLAEVAALLQQAHDAAPVKGRATALDVQLRKLELLESARVLAGTPVPPDPDLPVVVTEEVVEVEGPDVDLLEPAPPAEVEEIPGDEDQPVAVAKVAAVKPAARTGRRR